MSPGQQHGLGVPLGLPLAPPAPQPRGLCLGRPAPSAFSIQALRRRQALNPRPLVSPAARPLAGAPCRLSPPNDGVNHQLATVPVFRLESAPGPGIQGLPDPVSQPPCRLRRMNPSSPAAAPRCPHTPMPLFTLTPVPGASTQRLRGLDQLPPPPGSLPSLSGPHFRGAFTITLTGLKFQGPPLAWVPARAWEARALTRGCTFQLPG